MKKLFLLLALAFGIAGANAQIIKLGNITADETWTRDNIYLLSGFVYVKAPAVVTINPGTIIKGDFTSKGALIIERGAKLIANGTAEQPIVFTSQKAPGQRSYGDWGGLLIGGTATINTPANGTTGTQQGEAVFEGGVGTIYGGAAAPNDDDSSGVLRYVRIEFCGIPFQPNSEINGLTMGGVGRKTVIDHVQVSYGGDDAFEWFGGTVNAKHLVAYRNWDDDFDTDFGFTGNVQFGLSVRDTAIADQSGSNGFESDNDGTGTTNTPITAPNFSNFTIVGPRSFTSNLSNIHTNYRRALHLRRNTSTSVYNSVFVGYGVGLLIESSSTQSNATNDALQFRNSVLTHMGDTLAATTAANPNNSNGAFDITNWFNTSGWSNTTYNSVSELMFKNVSIGSPDFTLNSNSPLLAGASFTNSRLQNSFFTPTAYRGAFGTSNWTSCWAEWDPQSQAYNGAIDYSVTASIAAVGNTTICQGESVTLNTNTNAAGASYLWSNGATTASISATTAGAYSVTVMSARGCSEVSSTINVVVNPNPTAPTITANGNTSFCTGGSVQLTSSYSSGNEWSNGATTQNITVSASGNFTVTHTDGNGCQAVSNPLTTSVSSAPQPTVLAQGGLEFCEGGSVVLTASNSDSYLWSNGATTSTITVTEDGNYTVSVTNADACDETGTSDVVAVTVHPNPVADAALTENGLSVVFDNNSTGATEYFWDFGDGSYSIVENPTHEYSQAGNYIVTLTAENANNCEDARTLAIDVSVGIGEAKAFNKIALYPNPTAGIATLAVSLNEENNVQVIVSDIAGKSIIETRNEKLAAGNHSVMLDLRSLDSGLYFVMIKTDKAFATARLAVSR